MQLGFHQNFENIEINKEKEEIFLVVKDILGCISAVSQLDKNRIGFKRVNRLNDRGIRIRRLLKDVAFSTAFSVRVPGEYEPTLVLKYDDRNNNCVILCAKCDSNSHTTIPSRILIEEKKFADRSKCCKHISTLVHFLQEKKELESLVLKPEQSLHPLIPVEKREGSKTLQNFLARAQNSFFPEVC